MEEKYMSALVDMGVSLTTLALKGTATAINTKIKSIKDEKNLEKSVILTKKLLVNFYQNVKKLSELLKHIKSNLIG